MKNSLRKSRKSTESLKVSGLKKKENMNAKKRTLDTITKVL